MKKSDLKNGMVIEYRDGDRRLVVGDRLMGEYSYIKLHDYDEDLYFKDDVSYRGNDLDIVTIYDEIDTFNELNNKHALDIIWKRKWRPECGDWYYYPEVSNIDLYGEYRWANDGTDKYLLEQGLVFREAYSAMECAKKMLKCIKEEKQYE